MDDDDDDDDDDIYLRPAARLKAGPINLLGGMGTCQAI